MKEQLTGVLREVLAAEDGAAAARHVDRVHPGAALVRRADRAWHARWTWRRSCEMLPVPRVDGADPAAAFLATVTSTEPAGADRGAAHRPAVHCGGPAARSARAHIELGDVATARQRRSTSSPATPPTWTGRWLIDWHRGLAALHDGRRGGGAGAVRPGLLGGAGRGRAEARDRAVRRGGRRPPRRRPVLPDGVAHRPRLRQRRVRPGQGAAGARRAARGGRRAELGAGDVQPLRRRAAGRGPGPHPGAVGGATWPRTTWSPPASSWPTWRSTPSAARTRPARCWAPRCSGCWPAGAGPGTVLGSALTEDELRAGLERCYRTLARHADNTRERIALVDTANRIRPRTWV